MRALLLARQWEHCYLLLFLIHKRSSCSLLYCIWSMWTLFQMGMCFGDRPSLLVITGKKFFKFCIFWHVLLRGMKQGQMAASWIGLFFSVFFIYSLMHWKGLKDDTEKKEWMRNNFALIYCLISYFKKDKVCSFSHPSLVVNLKWIV